MRSDIALNSLQRIPKNELGLGFDNLVKVDSLDMHSVTKVVLRMVVSTPSSLTKSTMMNF